jgi:protein-S-isoprenylcysteine O-methyltransferase Ste14
MMIHFGRLLFLEVPIVGGWHVAAGPLPAAASLKAANGEIQGVSWHVDGVGACQDADRQGLPIMRRLERLIPPPLLLLIAGAAMWGLRWLTGAVAAAGSARLAIASAIAVAGLLFAAPAIIAFRRAATTISPVDIDAASALVTGGSYRLSRNPMYVGLTCLLLGWAVYLAAPWTLLGPLAFVLYVTRFQIVPEERVMIAKFGRDYVAYQARTRRWL